MNHKKTDDDTIGGNRLPPITYKECVTHFLPISVTATMNNKYYGKCKSYATSDSILENLYGQGVSDTGS